MGQCLVEGFKQPYRLEVAADSGWFLTYLKDGITRKQLNKERGKGYPFDISHYY